MKKNIINIVDKHSFSDLHEDFNDFYGDESTFLEIEKGILKPRLNKIIEIDRMLSLLELLKLKEATHITIKSSKNRYEIEGIEIRKATPKEIKNYEREAELSERDKRIMQLEEELAELRSA